MTALLVLALMLADCASDARCLEGTVTRVRDVDTIVVARIPVRLEGVDGPETGTPAGDTAARFMRLLVLGKTVVCALSGERTHDRWVGICALNGRDIGAIAIAAGHALDCPRFSGGRYRGLERQAARDRIPRAPYCARR